MNKTNEEYNNILNDKRKDYLDEFENLRAKLVEALKQNSNDDIIIKMRNDLNNLKQQVSDKDKELQSGNINRKSKDPV